MAIGTTTRDSNIYVNVLMEAVKAQFATKKALFGTGVAILKPGLPRHNVTGAAFGAGDKIQIPYFGSIGEMEDITESGAATLRKLTSTKEETSYVHSVIAGEVTEWARLAAQAADPNEALAEQYVEAAMRRIDLGLITKALATTLVQDNTGSTITYNGIIDACSKWGDQMGPGNGVKAMIVHSFVRAKLMKLRDDSGGAGVGRPLWQFGTPGAGGSQAPTLDTFMGIPVICSDRLTPTGNVYPTLFCQSDALIAWYSESPMKTDEDILADSMVSALHLYHAEHLYTRTPSCAKEGVVKLLTTET